MWQNSGASSAELLNGAHGSEFGSFRYLDNDLKIRKQRHLVMIPGFRVKFFFRTEIKRAADHCRRLWLWTPALLIPWNHQCRRAGWRTWPRPRAGRASRRSCRCASRRGPCAGKGESSTRAPWCCRRSASWGRRRTWPRRPPAPPPGWWSPRPLRTARKEQTSFASQVYNGLPLWCDLNRFLKMTSCHLTRPLRVDG